MIEPQTRAGKKTKSLCQAAEITLPMLSLPCTWDDRGAFVQLQKDLGVLADGLFWRKSIEAFIQRNSRSAIIDHQIVSAPKDVQFLNFLHPSVHKFGGRSKWMEAPDIVFVHESVTKTASRAIDILTRRHLSVHLVIHSDGTCTQHADLFRKCAHAGPGGFNKRSLALEMVNPYYGKYFTPGMGRELLKPCLWSHKGRDQGYITTTARQDETLANVIEWIWSAVPTVPRNVWHGMNENGIVRLGKLPKGERGAAPGVWAHHYTGNHADGSYPVARAEEILRCRRRS